MKSKTYLLSLLVTFVFSTPASALLGYPYQYGHMCTFASESKFESGGTSFYEEFYQQNKKEPFSIASTLFREVDLALQGKYEDAGSSVTPDEEGIRKLNDLVSTVTRECSQQCHNVATRHTKSGRFGMSQNRDQYLSAKEGRDFQKRCDYLCDQDRRSLQASAVQFTTSVRRTTNMCLSGKVKSPTTSTVARTSRNQQ